MSEKEYNEQDLVLLEKINEYNIDSTEHALQIAMNNKQAALLEMERKDLLAKYRNAAN